MLELILAVGLAIVASAFCSISEAAFYSFPWSRIEQLRKQGRPAGEILFGLRREVDRPITAILTLNTLANTAGASIAGAAWARLFGAENLGWFALAFTSAILIVSEILPKTLGVEYNRTLAPALAKPIRVLVLIFSPVILVCGYLARAVQRRKRGPETTEDDIRALVSLTRRSGGIKPFEEKSIRNILSLDTRTVEEIMTPRTVMFSLPADMTVAEVRARHADWTHSRIPVYDDNPEDIVGVVYRRLVLEALARDRDDLRLSDIMKPVRFVLENLSLDRLLAQLLESRNHLFVVLDEYGGVSGLVTLEDVVEEILGSEIMDETDEVPDMRELARRRRDELLKAGGGPSEE
ncbi:MAG: hemolysin family protein [Desulfovibrionaceae bacterium]|nr:HlyC/CorC family transporter [Desulfovibrionaceae bacterium]MDD4951443.1 hemolysin family protein [Desulfovibrionaceae bacterium]